MTPADGGAAFPSVCRDDPGHPASMPGMSLRDWFAGQALNACLDMPHNHGMTTIQRNSPMHPELAVRQAYRIADAMLAERAK